MPVNNKHIFTVLSHHAGQRIDRLLVEIPEIRTRSRAAKLISLGLVLKNGLPIKPSLIVSPGETFEILIPNETKNLLMPYEFALDIHYEDEYLLVINKPSGLVVHPSHGHNEKTLVNALIYHCKNLSMGFAENRPGIVHRLDKDTSGLMVVAKNDIVHAHLAVQFKNKTVNRRYKALCYGKPKQTVQRVESYLIRHPIKRKKFCSEALNPKKEQYKGKWSATNIEFIETFKNQVSLVHCRLETGRTHQIRVHMSELNLPLLNDPIYYSTGSKKLVQSKDLRALIEKTHRLGLHAYLLGFTHPVTQEVLEFKLDWPEDLQELVEYLSF